MIVMALGNYRCPEEKVYGKMDLRLRGSAANPFLAGGGKTGATSGGEPAASLPFGSSDGPAHARHPRRGIDPAHRHTVENQQLTKQRPGTCAGTDRHKHDT